MSSMDIELLRDRSMQARARLQGVRLELKQAQEGLKQATNELATLEATFAQERERLQRLQSGRGDVLAQFGQVTVYEFWLDVPGYKGPIAGASASLLQHGNIQQVSDVRSHQKSGLGGGIVGGLLLGPLGAAAGVLATRKNQVSTVVREVDTRELEFAVSGPGFAWSCCFPYTYIENARALKDLIVARGSIGGRFDALLAEQNEVVAKLASQRQSLQQLIAARKQDIQTFTVESEQSLSVFREVRLPLRQEVRFSYECLSRTKQYALLLLGPVLLLAWMMTAAVLFGMGEGTLAVYVGFLTSLHIFLIIFFVFLYMFKNRW